MGRGGVNEKKCGFVLLAAPQNRMDGVPETFRPRLEGCVTEGLALARRPTVMVVRVRRYSARREREVMLSKNCIYGALGALLISTSAHAGLNFGPGFEVTFAGGNQTVSGQASSLGSMTYLGNNIYHTNGFAAVSAGYLQWDALIDPDPFISGTFSITNIAAITQTFTVTFTLDSTVQFDTSLMNGAFSGTLNDANGDGSAAIGRVTGSAGFYSAFIDGNLVQSLGSSAYNYSGAAFGSAQIGPESFGPTAGPALTTTIGLQFRFNLSAGDSVSFSSLFNVVPAPGAVALLGAAGCIGSRRRR